MCGRYVAAQDPAALAEEFGVTAPVEELLEPDYNVAPTKPVFIIVEANGERAMPVARWGLVPSWAKDASVGARLVNARVETAAQKPSFRDSVAKRRCLLPADGYYEWQAATGPDAPRGSSGKPRKQPFYIHPADGSTLALAGLYAWWRDPALGEGAPWHLTCAVLTTEATGDLGRIHDRMPMTVARDDWERWLDPTVRLDPVSLLDPGMGEALIATPVATLVNNVRNNGPELIAPVP